MSISALSTEQQKLMITEVTPMVTLANALVVMNHEDSTNAQNVLKEIKFRRNRITEFFLPMKSKAYAAWKEICSSETSLDEPLQAAEKTIKNKVIVYSTEVDRKRQEEARLLEAKRQEAERKEREKLEAQAKAAEAKGKTEQAEALREKAENVVVQPTFTQQAPAPKVEGSSMSKIWKAEVLDVKTLCMAIAEGKAPATLLVPAGSSVLNGYAKLMQTNTTQFGIKIYQETSMSVRS